MRRWVMVDENVSVSLNYSALHGVAAADAGERRPRGPGIGAPNEEQLLFA